MHPVVKFIIRAVGGLIIGYALARVFWKTTDLRWAPVMAAVLVGLAYSAEWVRKQREK